MDGLFQILVGSLSTRSSNLFVEADEGTPLGLGAAPDQGGGELEGGDPVSSSGGGQDSREPVSTGGGSGDDPLGPDDPGGPNHEWFREGTIDPRKFERYLFDPDHPDNEGKAEGWRKVFGLGSGDAEVAGRLIREHLDRAEIVERKPRSRYRRWELLVPDCEGPNGNVAPLLTAWALDPDSDRPHLSTAFPRPESTNAVE